MNIFKHRCRTAMLDITDGMRSFRLDYEGHIALEKSLNRSPRCGEFVHICEFLFDINLWKRLEMTLHVTATEYDVLKEMILM